MSRIPFASLNSWRLSISALLAFALIACGGEGTAPTQRTVASVEVSPAQQTLHVGEQVALTARALDGQGQEIQGRAVGWTTSDAATATVSATGTVTALIAGNVQVRATIDGKVGAAQLTITKAPIASLTLNPVQATLAEGDTQAFAVVAKDAAGRVLEGRAFTWTSSNVGVATVSPAGLVTALAAGAAQLEVASEGVTTTAAITVTAAVVAKVELHPAVLALEEGATSIVTATARDAADRVIVGRPATWLSSDPAKVTVDASGKLTAIQAGQSTVTATVDGKSAALVVTVTRAPVASIDLKPNAFVLEIGESRQMMATPKDANGNELHGRAIAWTVTQGDAVISPDGVVTALRNAYISITATSEGVFRSSTATIVPSEDYAYDLLYHRAQGNQQSELFTVTPGAGTTPIRLNAGNVSRSASASPDGLRVAFAVSQAELGTGRRIEDIFAVDVSGLNMKQLTTADGFDVSPAWSPVAARIAYHHYDTNGRSDIWIMNADGTAQLNLTGDMPATAYRSSPAWSTDGSRIAFAQRESGVAGTEASIWTMRADGTDKRKLTSTFSGFDASPTWSSDNARVAFVRYYNGDADISIVGASGGAVQRLAIAGLQQSPAWSPDGQFIAFSQDQGPVTNLFTMRPDGTQIRLRTLMQAWGGGSDPAWIRKR